MKRPTTLFGLLKNPTYVMVGLGFAFLLFDVQYYLMSVMPGYRDQMCVMGAGLTPENLSFAALISLMSGLFVVGFYHTIKLRAKSYGSLSISSVGALIGTITVFCPACALPVLSVFGFGVGLTFLTTYNLAFKMLSFALVSFGLFQINRQIKGECETCIT